jgi:hypothetical protein
MQYIVNEDKFIKLNETGGILYVKEGAGVEVCTDGTPKEGTGVSIAALDNKQFAISADAIWVRSLRGKTIINFIACNISGGGGAVEITEADITEEDVESLFD